MSYTQLHPATVRCGGRVVIGRKLDRPWLSSSGTAEGHFRVHQSTVTYSSRFLQWYMLEVKYLGVTITCTGDLRWNTHVSNFCAKANRTLGFLRRNAYSCPQEVKEADYKRPVRPVQDYGSSVWDPQVQFFRKHQKACKSAQPDS